MNVSSSQQRFDTVVIGGGQAGLAIGYYLARQGRDFVILEAHDRIGTSWRRPGVPGLRVATPAVSRKDIRRSSCSSTGGSFTRHSTQTTGWAAVSRK